MSNENIFPDIKLGCACYDEQALSAGLARCFCSETENAVRHYANGTCTAPMSEEQRQYLVDDADWSAEGALDRAELEQMDDRQLARATLQAWTDYVNTHF